MEVELSLISPDPNQPRKIFDEAPLRELELSIREHGVLQPIAVRAAEDGRYVIVAGERRWRASLQAGLTKIPVHVLSEREEISIMEAALIENIQRQDLNPVEEAFAYKHLVEKHGSVQAVAEKVGKSRPVVSNAIRLLTLPKEILSEVKSGRLSVAHAVNILSIRDQGLRIKIAWECIENNLTIKDLQSKIEQIKSAVIKGEDLERLYLGKNSFNFLSEKEVNHGDVWELGQHILIVRSLMTEWEHWTGFLKPGRIFCPYPGPFVILTKKAKDYSLVLVQPNKSISSHIIFSYEKLMGGVAKKLAGEA